MKQYSYYRKKTKHISLTPGERRKKRGWIVSIIFLLIFLWEIGLQQENETLFVSISSWFVPILTYESQYGKANATYFGNYYVLDSKEHSMNEEHLMKDETKRIESNNMIKEQKKAEEKTKEKIPTLAKGENTISFTRNQLKDKDFLKQKIFVIDANTSMTEEELSLEHLLDTDLSVKGLTDWNGTEPKECKVLIYHTHGSEAFRDSRPGEKEDTIIGIGSYLSKVLEEQYHIPVYHDTTVYDQVNGVNDRSAAYEYAYKNITEILKKNPSIEVVIDLHRDGVDEDISLVTEVNGKKTAKIMFLNGVSRSNTNGEIAYLNNPYRMQNLAFSFQMYLKGKEQYGDYIRKIYVKSLRFNMHLMPRSTLIEVGAQNNTIEEEKNAMEPLADILYRVLSEEK